MMSIEDRYSRSAKSLDLDAILDRATRRARALQGGKLHPTTCAGPRDDAVSPLDRPELLWPTERRLVPTTCWHCGAGSGMFETDAPYGLQKRGEVRCVACSRCQVRLKADGTRPVAASSTPPRCPCGGEAIYWPDPTECGPCANRRKAREAMRAFRARKAMTT